MTSPVPWRRSDLHCRWSFNPQVLLEHSIAYSWLDRGMAVQHDVSLWTHIISWLQATPTGHCPSATPALCHYLLGVCCLRYCVSAFCFKLYCLHLVTLFYWTDRAGRTSASGRASRAGGKVTSRRDVQAVTQERWAPFPTSTHCLIRRKVCVPFVGCLGVIWWEKPACSTNIASVYHSFGAKSAQKTEAEPH